MFQWVLAHIANNYSGHTQPEHDTSHGSMSRTRWAVDGPDGTTIELDGHKFAASDDGAPMLCSLVCRTMGRHAHIDFCRTISLDGVHGNHPETQHIKTRLNPEPDKPKDHITHALYWRRLGMCATADFEGNLHCALLYV